MTLNAESDTSLEPTPVDITVPGATKGTLTVNRRFVQVCLVEGSCDATLYHTQTQTAAPFILG